MGLYRVWLTRTTVEYGYIDIEADDPGLAMDRAGGMDRWTLEDEGVFGGSCGDECNIEVAYEEKPEEITPPSVSDGLWS